MIFVKHKEAFCSLAGQLPKGQSEEQHFPWDALAAEVLDFSSPVIFWVQASVCVRLCSPLLLLHFLCKKHPGHILSWCKSARLSELCLLSCHFSGMTFQSCITPRASKIHGRAAQLCGNTVTRCAPCRSMCWKQQWRMSWWDLPSAKGLWGRELQFELLPEYSFRVFLHPPSMLLYFPVLSSPTECPDTLYWYGFHGMILVQDVPSLLRKRNCSFCCSFVRMRWCFLSLVPPNTKKCSEGPATIYLINPFLQTCPSPPTRF